MIVAIAKVSLRASVLSAILLPAVVGLIATPRTAAAQEHYGNVPFAAQSAHELQALQAVAVQEEPVVTRAEIDDINESLRNLRIGLWATVAALGILIFTTGLAAMAFLRIGRQNARDLKDKSTEE